MNISKISQQVKRTQQYYDELGKIWNKGNSYLNPKTGNYTHVYHNKVVVTIKDIHNSVESLRQMDIQQLKRKELFVTSCEWKDKTVQVTNSKLYFHHYMYIGDGEWAPVYLYAYPSKIINYNK